MNKIYYCGLSGGFFNESVHENIPDSAVELSHEEYNRLLDGQENGKKIIFSCGKPSLADHEISDETVAANVLHKRNKILHEVSEKLQAHLIQSNFDGETDLTNEEAIKLAKYSKELRDIPKQSGFPHNIIWPSDPLSSN